MNLCTSCSLTSRKMLSELSCTSTRPVVSAVYRSPNPMGTADALSASISGTASGPSARILSPAKSAGERNLVRAEVLETTRLPPSKDTNPSLGPEILSELLPKGPVENLPCILLCREEVGNVKHLDIRIDRGVVAIRGIRHFYGTVPHLVHTADRISKRAAVDNLNSQRAGGPGFDVAFKDLVHAIDEINARHVFGESQSDLNVFLSTGRL